MNFQPMVWFAGLLGLGLPMVVVGQEGGGEVDSIEQAQKLPPIIRVQVEWIEVKHEVLTKLMAKPRTSSNDAALRKEVKELIAAGKATVRETMIGVAQDMEKATTGSAEEFIYPTEYDPPEVPNYASSGKQAQSYVFGPNPTAYQTRQLGSKFEAKAYLHGSNRVVDLELSTGMVYHCRNEVRREWKGVQGDGSVKVPVMFCQSFDTEVTMFEGQPLLIATVSPKDDSGFPDYTRKLMLFARCEVLQVER